MMKSVDTWAPSVQVRRRDPFGFALAVFAGAPAFFGKGMVAAAAEGELVDVGGAALGVGDDVVDFAVVTLDVAARG